ncbi:aldehyde dehydrogenase family protein [Paraburkholderia acidisoli]|uniref:Aldehyde dehydrogenase family protein n=1 Tax=Paraburkholderia acidisoli TaxID=2571748 RepID=A0A7Z2JIE5_9BURK|nr:aldehyde dehydrogenase family protein [Paraburkholderia acidisoli]QGZ64284.1 aldehyde dehydrogenase family protein [Paraburkholderia acidisoli]
MNTLADSIFSTPRSFDHFIDGQWHAGRGDTIVRNSPAHGVPVSTVRAGTAEDVDRAVAAARRRFEKGGWANITSAQRATYLRRAADLIGERVDALAMIETLESGKPLAQSKGEIEGAVALWHYAAGQAQALHGETHNTFGDGLLGLVLREPVGVVGLITPWNFPFWILAERLPFILAAGCTVVVKPSEYTSSTTLMMAEILRDAGVPDGVVNVVTGYGDPVGQAIVEHRGIDMVSFTGSTRVGRSAVVASAGNLKKLSLELGGKNPVIVCADADLDKAADGIVYGVCFNAGQCCVSGSRLIVAKDVMQPLSERIVALMKQVRVGDPLDEATQVGPIVNEAQMQRILRLIGTCPDEGGRVLTGGERVPPENGYFVAPTLLGGVQSSMTVAREEIFGPVLAMMPFDTLEQAIDLANDTDYGLSATVWTQSLDQSMHAMRKMRAGRVWVNTTITGGPEMPIGGYKESGLGRETGLQGVAEYTEVKSALIDLGARQKWVRTA